MYLAIAVRACRWVGNTCRCTHSFFSVPKNDSASALSQQTPVRPIDWRIPCAASAARNVADVYWVQCR